MMSVGESVLAKDKVHYIFDEEQKFYPENVNGNKYDFKIKNNCKLYDCLP